MYTIVIIELLREFYSWKWNLTKFSLYSLVTRNPNFKCVATVMASPTVKYGLSASSWCIYAEILRKLCELLDRFLPFTVTVPVTPVSLYVDFQSAICYCRNYLDGGNTGKKWFYWGDRNALVHPYEKTTTAAAARWWRWRRKRRPGCVYNSKTKQKKGKKTRNIYIIERNEAFRM